MASLYFNEEKIIREQANYWANHIIDKFGKKEANNFAHSDYHFSCPCNCNNRNCRGCDFYEGLRFGYGCKDALDYHNFLMKGSVIRRYVLIRDIKIKIQQLL